MMVEIVISLAMTQDKVLHIAKNNKAMGYDYFLNEVMKSDLSVTLVCSLFQKAFSTIEVEQQYIVSSFHCHRGARTIHFQ